VIELRDLFNIMLEKGASDLHLVVGAPPQIRVHGDLESIEGYKPLQSEHTRELIFGILSNEQRQKLETQWELDFSYSLPGVARWRVNTFFQRDALGAAFRVIPEKIKPLSDLGVPDALYRLCDLPRGLVLVTGPTGSGKSTTLAGIIDVINQTRHDHILTVEDPIEFIHQHKNCIVNQREVGSDTEGFARALKSALRQDPDVILVGEMRDLETIQTALTAAETGHLVFGTLHTNGAAKTVDRVIDVFPPHQQDQVRVQLASSLQGVVTQALVPRKDGQGRVPACEVMMPNPAIRNLIREAKVFQIPSVMQTSQDEGMQTLDACLATLVRSGVIDKAEAIKRCAEPNEFARLLASGAGAPVGGTHVFNPPERLRLIRKFEDVEDGTPGEAPVAAHTPPAPPASLAEVQQRQPAPAVSPVAPAVPPLVPEQPRAAAPPAAFDRPAPDFSQPAPAHEPAPQQFAPVQSPGMPTGMPPAAPHMQFAPAPAAPAPHFEPAAAPEVGVPEQPLAHPNGDLQFPNQAPGSAA
jgi:twitching motility protein PilT